MRQEIGLDIVFHERLELFDDKQLVDACGKLTDPVKRQWIGETYFEHSSRNSEIIQGVNDIVERAAHRNDPHPSPDTDVDEVVQRARSRGVRSAWLTDLQERTFHRTLNIQKRLPLPNRSTQGGTVMEKWICTVCGYVYDPAIGDSTQEINPGIKFEDLPESWVCPDCGASKDLFEKA